ncbi:MAG: 3,4-dihydroxy-2-butanone-4-phosphate synthase [Rhodospirillales bacterium]|nr:3,4-dihydroxy-2-butanone-4-phosphate synthase [Alphaproteobacteria bacterium]MCB9976577.1 3,4-dihydroxy-2-butanone-4-phosphate synthase [Rhodospirillales bacterium]
MKNQLASIPNLLDDARTGRMVILIDDERRENEGDLVIPASIVTPEHINFMATHGRGLICLAMSGSETDRLGLPPMSKENDCRLGTAFTVSIDAREDITTGISAFDRAHTIRTAADPHSTRQNFRIPGHVFPLRACNGGVLERPGHTEAAVELSNLAGRGEAAVICEIMNDDGTMARLPDLFEFASRYDLQIGSIAALIEYVRSRKDAA